MSATETSPSIMADAYTHEPRLHHGLFRGSLQLFGWLFFHPSAWRNHVIRIAPSLHPNFTLLELREKHWRNPDLRRLLLMAYIILPLWLYVLIGAVLLLCVILGVLPRFPFVSDMSDLGGVLYSTAWFMISTVVVGLIVGSTVGVAAGVAGGLADGMTRWLTAAVLPAIMAPILRIIRIVYEQENPTWGIASSLAGIVAASIIGKTVGAMAEAPGANMARRVKILVAIAAVILGIGLAELTSRATNLLYDLGFGAALAVILAIMVKQNKRDWRPILTFGALVGMLYGVAANVYAGYLTSIFAPGFQPFFYVVVYLLLSGLEDAAPFGVLFALFYLPANRIAGPNAGIAVGVLGVGAYFWFFLLSWIMGLISEGFYIEQNDLKPTFLAVILVTILAATQNWWRPVALYPFFTIWNLFLYRADVRNPDRQPSRLRWHSAFWDETQRLSLVGLASHLVLISERNPAEANAAMSFLIATPQHRAVQAAQIQLSARGLERCTDIKAVSEAHRSLAANELEGPESTLLRSFSRVSQDVSTALQQQSNHGQRLALSAVEDRLDSLVRELNRSDELYVYRFRPLAAQWRQIVADQVKELTKAVEQRQEIDSPYIIGVPITEQQQIFVGRTDISARIEQLLLDRRRPPMLLYGQRRLGKTSLLFNLGRLLPSNIVPLFVDFQGIAVANNHAGFLYNLARGMTASAEKHRNLLLPALSRESLADDPFTRFDEWLDQVEKALGENSALLMLDEFETLFGALADGRFSETDVLGMLRHLIQHRPRFKVLLAGSHTLDEFRRWASYLINVQVIRLGYLKEEEALQLIEHPTPDFALCYEPDASRRVVDLTRGHPFLVQQLCAEIIALKNEQMPVIRRLARLPDVEAAIPEALSHGALFYSDIEINQIDSVALALLRFIATRGEGAIVSQTELARQFADEFDLALDLLLRRDLIEPINGGYRFQVEMIRRWFVKPALRDNSTGVSKLLSDRVTSQVLES